MKIKINVARSAGFCFGVKRALDIAVKTSDSYPNVYMLGDIVHNETVIKDIRKSGIKTIERISSGEDKTLIIRAHGTARKTIDKAVKAGYRIIDATCPMVKEIHKIAKENESKDYAIAVIGDKRHDEVRGIIGQLHKKPYVIDDIHDKFFDRKRKIKKLAIVVQSTQDPQKVSKIVEKISALTDELKFYDTICNPTKVKQDEAKKLPLNNDMILVAGSRSSANTRRLYEISRSLNPETYWIGSEKEISPAWFDKKRSVGITAGASTPDSTIKKIIDRIRSL